MEADPLYCTPCGKQFSGWANVEEHNRSPAHQKAVLQKQTIADMTKSLNILPSADEDDHVSLGEFMMTEDQNIFICELCNITCAGRIPALSHVRGKSHQKKQRQRSLQGNLQHSLTTVASSSPINQHSAYVPTSQDASVFERHSVTGHFFCTVCKLSVSGEVPAQQHLIGKSHAKKVKIAKGRSESDLSLSFSNLTVSTTVSSSLSSATSGVSTQRHGETSQVVLPSLINKSNQQLAVDTTTTNERNDQQEDDGIHHPEDKQSSGDEADSDRLDNHQDLQFNENTRQWYCKVCQVSLNSEKTIQQHFVGKAHHKKKKAAGIKLGELDGAGVMEQDSGESEEVEFDERSGQWRCKTCNVYLTSEIPLQEHLSGKAHQKQKTHAEISITNDGLTQLASMEEGSYSKNGKSFHGPSPNEVGTQDMLGLGGLSMPGTSSFATITTGQNYNLLGGRQSHHIAWERSPHLDENLNLSDVDADRRRIVESSAVSNTMTSDAQNTREIHLPGTYNETCYSQKSTQQEGLGFDPATSASSGASPYIFNSDQDIYKYWNVQHNSHTVRPQLDMPSQQTPISSNVVRPPPGFSQDVLPSNKPLSDFLTHQLNATTDPPSYMHRFWSMTSDQQNDQSSLSSGGASNKALIPPIGTPSSGSNVPEQAPDQSVLHVGGERQQSIDVFIMDRETQKLVCQICNIFVTGAESAEAHLKGTKHAKKLRVYQFQMKHMIEPQITIQGSAATKVEKAVNLQNHGYRTHSSFGSSVGTSSLSSSEGYEYNYSSSSSNSSASLPVAKTQHSHPEGVSTGNDIDNERFHSLRGVSLNSSTNPTHTVSK